MRQKLIAWGVPLLAAFICCTLIALLLVRDHHFAKLPERPLNFGEPTFKASQAPQQAAAPSGAAPAQSTATNFTHTSVLPANIPGSWPGFRGPNGNDICPDKTALSHDWKAHPPRLLWTLDMGEGYASAAVDHGRCFVLDYNAATQQDVLRCFSLATGQDIWRQSYPDAVKRNHGMSRTTPAVKGKYVVSLGPKCHVICADTSTGKIYWQHDLVTEFGTTVPQWYAGQCPLIDGNRVILAPAGKALMIAVDLASGKVLWQTPNPMNWQMTHSSIATLDYHGQRMYVYCGSGGVAGVSATDGHILWQTTDWTVNTATVPTPIPIGGGKLLFTGGYGAGAAMLQVNGQGNAFTVSIDYKLPPEIFGSDQQTPIFYGGYIYGVKSGGELVCMDTSGKPRWTSGVRRFGLGPYLIADGLIYIMDDTGTLTMAQASPDAYRELGQIKILNGPDAWGPMALVDGLLIARDLTHMVCLDISTR